MAWEERRGAATATATRRVAHADDAKERVDERTSVRPRLPRWAVVVGAGLLLLLLGATAVAVLPRGDDSPGETVDTAAEADASSGATPRTPSAEDPTGSAAEESSSGTISYSGQLRSNGSSRRSQIGVFCKDVDDCNVTGFSMSGQDVLALRRLGPGSFRVNLPGVPPTCAGASKSKVSGSLQLSGRTMSMKLTTPGYTVACDDGGSLTQEPQQSTFAGTYVSGEIPGFSVD